jgi:hypothetical protein
MTNERTPALRALKDTFHLMKDEGPKGYVSLNGGETQEITARTPDKNVI